jgi:hypothetical protein
VEQFKQGFGIWFGVSVKRHRFSTTLHIHYGHILCDFRSNAKIMGISITPFAVILSSAIQIENLSLVVTSTQWLVRRQ